MLGCCIEFVRHTTIVHVGHQLGVSVQNPASGRVWFISREGQQYGPVSDAEVTKLIELGHLSPVDYVWSEGMGNWAEARTVPELVALRPKPPPPPLPPTPPPAPAQSRPAAPFVGGNGQTAQYAPVQPAAYSRPQPSSQTLAAGSAVGGLGDGGLLAGTGVASGHHGGTSAEPKPGTDESTIVLIAYVLLLLPVLLLPLIGVIIAFVNRGSAPPWLETHYRWQIRTFFMGLLYMLVGSILSLVAIGFLILLATVVWHIVRVVKGIMALNRREPIANPGAWLW